jgi:hypothetical protein
MAAGEHLKRHRQHGFHIFKLTFDLVWRFSEIFDFDGHIAVSAIIAIYFF